MRLCWLIGLSVVAGVATGYGLAWYRFHRYPWEGVAASPVAPADVPRSPKPGVPPPKALVVEPVYDFGNMDMHGVGEHAFEIRNLGGLPLRLTRGTTSCKCTVTDFEEAEVAPGQSVTIRVQWKAEGLLGPYSQTATIMTNDPDRPEITLSIKGQITAAIRPEPAELVFSRLGLGEAVSGRVKLFAYRPGGVEVTGWSVEDPKTKPFFEVSLTPLAVEEVQAEPGATGGYQVGVMVKSGLPLGAFQQKILLTTNLAEAPTVSIPVRGTVASEVAIVGPGWDAETGVLSLGIVASPTGAQRTLRIRVGGPRCMEVKARLVSVEPADVLNVTVGEATALSSGRVALIPVVIEVPKGSRPANHLGPDSAHYGRILIETDHPDARQLQILVRFAVEG